MPTNLENSVLATGLGKVSFHSNPKERQCQRVFKLLHTYTHLTHQQSNAQNSPSKPSTLCEPRISRCLSWIQKRQRNLRSNHQHHRNVLWIIQMFLWIIEKAREFQKNIYFCFIDYAKASDCVDHDKLWTFLKRWRYQTTLPDS